MSYFCWMFTFICELSLFCLTGKRGRLLSQPFAQNPELRDFLATDNTRYLSWLHDIGTGDFNGVSELVT